MSRDLVTSHGLTPIQNAMVNEYFANGMNKAGAAKKLGHSVTIFNDPRVERCLAEVRREISVETDIKAIAIIEKLGKIAMADLGDYIEPTGGGYWRVKNDIPKELMFAISELGTDKDGVTKIKLHNPFEAVEKLGKMMGWFKEIAITNNLNINTQESNLDETAMKRELAFQLARYLRNNEDVVIDVVASEVENGGSKSNESN